MRLKRGLTMLFALSLSTANAVGEVVRSQSKWKDINVSARFFNEQALVDLARSELARAPRREFTQLLFYGEPGGAPTSKPNHGSYDYWRRLYEVAAQTPNAIAEVISIDNNVILRMRDLDGKVTRRVLSGDDPLRMVVNSDPLEIVYISFRPSSLLSEAVSVYARTSAPLRAETGLILLRQLESALGDLQVSLAIRHDGWFIYQPGYPFLNPFLEEANLPTHEEYDKEPTLVCGRSTGTMACGFR